MCDSEQEKVEADTYMYICMYLLYIQDSSPADVLRMYSYVL